MNIQTQQHHDFIKMVANRLAEKFIRPLFEFTHEKNYSAHIGGLAEILDWASEFSELYYNHVIEWETFRHSRFNVYKAETLSDFIIAFGQERLKTFSAQNANRSNYFLEKYSVVTKKNYHEEFYYSP